MIRLTDDCGDLPIYVNPETIDVIGLRSTSSDFIRTRINIGEKEILVKESPSEVARKVLEYKKAWVNYQEAMRAVLDRGDMDETGIGLDAQNKLNTLAGLEDTNEDR